MERYCQNPLCENEATKIVPVSVDHPSDQKRSLCAVCEEAYSWGVQHGCMTSTPKRVWVLHVSSGGAAIHSGIFRSKRKAVQDLIQYMRTEEAYCGPGNLPGICDWIAEHDERLGVDIFPAAMNLR
ncbi:MAG: hypothetical protein ABFE13_10990 [Phycisphaerales bacterium]